MRRGDLVCRGVNESKREKDVGEFACVELLW
jgi:hypothetical protein